MPSVPLAIRTLHPEFLGQSGGDTEQDERAGNPDAESNGDLVDADMNETVNDSQANVAPCHTSGGFVVDIQQGQGQDCCVELSRLLQEVVEVVRRPLDESRKFRGLFLLYFFRIEVDVVFSEGGGSAPVKETFDRKSPETETGKGPQERLAANDDGRGHDC